jgi:hypothetical protein
MTYNPSHADGIKGCRPNKGAKTALSGPAQESWRRDFAATPVEDRRLCPPPN